LKGCSIQDLQRATLRDQANTDEEPRYTCQITEVCQFSTPVRWWNPLQYWEDFRSGNVALGEMCRSAFYVVCGRRGARRLPFLRTFFNWVQKVTGGMPSPVKMGTLLPGSPHPVANLDLQPGELVRVKSHNEILATLGSDNMNRGLYFDVELVPYCGGRYKVKSRVERFVDEKTGKMRKLKTPAVILESVVCRSRYAACRLFCPRSIYAWWRESWLQRDEENTNTNSILY
jgi:hypothetical protein